MVHQSPGGDGSRDDFAARDGPVPHDTPRELQARRVLWQQGLRLEPHCAVFRRVTLDERDRVRAPDGRRVPREETGAPVRRLPAGRREAQGVFASAPRRRRDFRLVAAGDIHGGGTTSVRQQGGGTASVQQQGEQGISRYGADVRGYAMVRTVRGELQGARECTAGRPARRLREGALLPRAGRAVRVGTRARRTARRASASTSSARRRR